MAVRYARANRRNHRGLSLAPFLLRHHARAASAVPRRIPLALKLLAVLALLAGGAIFLVGLSGAAGLGVYAYYAGQLKGQLDRLNTRQVFESSKIYDRNGYLLYELFAEGRRTRITSLDQVPKELIWATIATEDKNFYANPGVDPAGIARAVRDFLRTGQIQGGGSTLTQQFIRNALFPPEERYSQRLERKIKEAILALELTRIRTKDEILLMYLNEISYGNLSYGVEAAAQGYFGKHVWELDLAECAFLAGLPKSPTEYNPFFAGGYEKAKDRQYHVLRRMVEDGYITQAQADAAYHEELHFARPEIRIEAPHFVMYVRELLEKDPRIGPERLYGGGLRITTTLDIRYQRLGEAVLRERLAQEDAIAYNANNGALVAMRPATGEILAMVGSVDYNLVKPSPCGLPTNVVDGQVNAALADRQPGSSFKPFTYLQAFMKGWTPATMVLDVKTEFPVPGQETYVPKNYDNKFRGPVRLRNALGCSLNVPAIKVIQFAGVGETIELAHRMGITGLSRGLEYYGLSLTLGGGEVNLRDMVNAYSTLANEGRYVPPQVLLRVTDSQGNVLVDYRPKPLEEQPQVVDPLYTYLITNVLSDDKAREGAFGPHSVLELSRPAAVKTGTSEDWADNWTIGYTPYLAVGVWVGNNNNEPMTLNCAPRGAEHARGIPSVRTAGRIWHNFMEAVFHPLDEQVGLPRYFPEEDLRLAYFANPDLEDVLRDENGQLQYDFRRPQGIVDVEVCAVSGKLPGPSCPRVMETFVQGTEPRDVCTVHKPMVVVQIPGSNPPRYCLPREGVSYPPELVQEQVFLDLWSVAKLEERAGLEEWMREAGIPQVPTMTCPLDLGVPQPGQPGQPPPNRWAGLVRTITYPTRYDGITGTVEIRGSADLVSSDPKDQFAYYIVEWGQKGPSGEMPTEWHNVAEDVGRTPVHNGVLAVWDPSMLPDGAYVLRLTVVTKEGRPRFSGDEPGHTYVPVYLDRGPIYVRLLSPTPGSVLTDPTVTLVAKVESVSPAARVDFFYDGIFVGTAITSTVYPLSERVYTVTWAVRPGEHRLLVEAVNTAGRRGTSQAVLVVGRPPEGMVPPVPAVGVWRRPAGMARLAVPRFKALYRPSRTAAMWAMVPG